jgi:hypothetical protein
MLATHAAELLCTGSFVASACQTWPAGNVPQAPAGPADGLPLGPALGLADDPPTTAVPGSAAPEDPVAAVPAAFPP